ncbi:MAG: conjugative transposon protein TraK [Bacteroidetes bacterium]|nr:conjugative transposon protein TraK [Bacteroidota bacterium]
MFNQFKNMDETFRQVRRVSLGLIIACIAICGMTMYFSFRQVSKSSDRIYILANGKVLEAVSASRKDNVPVEARDHIRVFHELFFSLEPDEKAIQASIGKALYLADLSAKKLYDNIKEAGYLAGIISGNMSQRVEVDSIQLDPNSYPYHFRCYATETITRASSQTTRSLITEGWLRHTARYENNPHGFMIEKFQVVSNQDIKVENRGL